MKKNKKLKAASKTTLAVSLLASTVVPYATPASAEAVTMTTGAQVTTAIAALDPSSATYVADVQLISTAFNALIPSEKAKVTTSNKTKITNHLTAIVVVQAIDDFVQSAVITAETDAATLNGYNDQITILRNQYTSQATVVRSYIKNSGKLTTVETAITNQFSYLAIASTIQPWLTAYSQLPTKTVTLTSATTLQQFKALDPNAIYLSEELQAITDARTAYTELSTTAKKYVDATHLSKLATLEAVAIIQNNLSVEVNQEALTTFTNLVNAITPTATNYVQAVADMNTAKTRLNSAVAALITSSTNTKIVNHTAAAVIVAEINNLPSLTTIENATSSELTQIEVNVKTARTNYGALTTAQRSYVGNLSTLTAIENAIATRKTAANYDSELADWTSVISKIATVTPKTFPENLAIADFGTADKYTSDQLGFIKEARKQYDKLTPTLLKYAGTANVQALTNHEASAEIQAGLQTRYDKYVSDQAAAVDLAVQPFKTALTNIGIATPLTFNDLTVATVTVANFAEVTKYTSTQQTAIQTARTEYGKLTTPAQQAKVANELSTLAAHEAAVILQGQLQQKVNELKDEAAETNQPLANTFTSNVNALDALVIENATEEQITAYKNAVAALNGAEAAFVDLLTSATKTKIKNHRTAATVVPDVQLIDLAAINAIDAAADDAQTSLTGLKEAVTTADTAYKKLTAVEKGYVDKLTNNALATAKSAVETKQAAITNTGALDAFNVELGKLPDTAYDFEDADIYSYKSTLNENNSYTAAQKTLISTTLPALYAELSDANKTAVDTAVDGDNFAAFLLTHSTALGQQATLADKIAAYALVKTDVEAFEGAVDALTFTDLTVEFDGLSELAEDTPTYDDDDQKVLIKAAVDKHQTLVSKQVNTEFIDGNRVTKLNGFKTSLATQIGFEEGAVAKFKGDVGNLATTTNLTNLIAAIDSLTTTYGGFDAEEKATLTVEKATLDKFGLAKAVLTSIKDLSPDYANETASADINSYITAAGQVRTAYNALDLNIRAVVRDIGALTTLSDYETALTTKKDALLATEALATWTTEFNKVEGVTFTYAVGSFDYAAYTGFEADHSTDVTNVGSAKTAYDKLTEANKSGQATNYGKVTALDGAFTNAKNRINAIDSALATFNLQLEALAFASDYTAPDYSGIDVFAEDFDAADDVPTFGKLEGIREIIATFDAIDAEFQAFIAPATITLIGNLKTSVTGYDAVETALNNKPAILTALADWQTAFNAINVAVKYEDTDLNTVDVFTITKDNVNTTTDYKAYEKPVLDAIVAARTEFDKLPKSHATLGNLQNQVKAADKAKLISLEKSVKAYDDAWAEKAQEDKIELFEAITDALEDLDANVDATNTYSNYLTNVKAVEDLVAALPAILVTEFNTTDEATTLANHQEVVKIVKLINAAGTVAAIEGATTQAALDAIGAKIEAARTAYTSLTDDQEAILTDTNIVALKTALDKANAIITWTIAYNGDLPEVLDFTGITYTELDDVSTYTAEEKAIINGLSTIFKGFTETVQGYIPAAQKTYFESLKAALDKQIELEDDKAEAELATILKGWKDAYKALPANKPDFSAITDENIEATILGFANVVNKYTAETLPLIQAARDAYAKLEEDDTLAPTVLESIEDEFDVLKLHEAARDRQLELQTAYDNKVNSDKLATFTNALDELDADLDTYVTDFDGVKSAYEALSEDLVATLTEAQVTLYADHKAAVAMTKTITAATEQSVLNAIAAATTISQLESAGNPAKQAKIDLSQLSPAAKGFIKNLDVLESTIKAIDERKTAIQNAGTISDWTTAYNALPVVIDLKDATVGNINSYEWYSSNDLGKITALENVLKGYDEATKALVPTGEKSKLTAYLNNVALYDMLKYQAQNAATDAAALVNWQAAYDALPDVLITTNLDVTTYKDALKYEDGITTLIETAEKELGLLSEVLKKNYVTNEQTQKITDLKASVAKYATVKIAYDIAKSANQAEEIKQTVSSVAPTNPDFVEEALALKELYDGLSEEDKAKISAADKTKIVNYSSAANILTLILDVPTVEEINAISAAAADKDASTQRLADIRGQIAGIRTQHMSNTTLARSYVSTYNTLSAIETAITAKEKQIANNQILVSWTTAVGNLPSEEVDLSAITTLADYEAAYSTARPYDETAALAITTARAEYQKLTSSLQALVSTVDLDRLVQLEANIKIQTNYETQLLTKRVSDFTNIVNALAPAAANYVEQVEAVKEAFARLDADVVAKLTTSTKTKVADHSAAIVIVQAINAIADLTEETEEAITAYKEAVKQARADYAALTTAQRSYVKNLSVLTAHENVVAGL